MVTEAERQVKDAEDYKVRAQQQLNNAFLRAERKPRWWKMHYMEKFVWPVVWLAMMGGALLIAYRR